MSVELTMLLYSVALLVVVIVIQASTAILAQGVEALAGPRDNLGEPTVLQARTKRCADNHREGLLIFAPLVLIAAALDVSTSLTVLGSQLFFYSRVIHAGIYIAGVPWVRPVFWAIGMAGCVMIFIELIGI